MHSSGSSNHATSRLFCRSRPGINTGKISNSILLSVVVYMISTPGAMAITLEQGKQFALDNCARCHAVGISDLSPEPKAPAFRDLAGRWPLSSLEEALAEGMVTSHKEMPEVVMEPGMIAGFLEYLESISAHLAKDPLISE